ncbi:MAG TPA: hypothetical protein VLF71_01915 [Candidatus Saccharimonadales bacterium]|nr:hypothetical protein [Candidatus Saccharimonadales bacterium]
MSVMSRFAHLVGRAPFDGKHHVKWAYGEGVRARFAGDQQAAADYAHQIDRHRQGNIVVAVGALAVGVADVMPGTALPEGVGLAAAGAALAVAAGAAASAATQQYLLRRLGSSKLGDSGPARPTGSVTAPSTEPLCTLRTPDSGGLYPSATPLELVVSLGASAYVSLDGLAVLGNMAASMWQ